MCKTCSLERPSASAIASRAALPLSESSPPLSPPDASSSRVSRALYPLAKGRQVVEKKRGGVLVLSFYGRGFARFGFSYGVACLSVRLSACSLARSR